MTCWLEAVAAIAGGIVAYAGTMWLVVRVQRWTDKHGLGRVFVGIQGAAFLAGVIWLVFVAHDYLCPKAYVHPVHIAQSPRHASGFWYPARGDTSVTVSPDGRLVLIYWDGDSLQVHEAPSAKL